ncbi:hypothetical protein D9M71_429600 [compost metagenome]
MQKRGSLAFEQVVEHLLNRSRDFALHQRCLRNKAQIVLVGVDRQHANGIPSRRTLEHFAQVRLILAAQIQLMTQGGKARGLDVQLAGIAVLKARVSTFLPRCQLQQKISLGGQGTARQEFAIGGKILHCRLEQALLAWSDPQHATQQYRFLMNFHQLGGIDVEFDIQVGFQPGLEQRLGEGAQALKVFQCRGQGSH